MSSIRRRGAHLEPTPALSRRDLLRAGGAVAGLALVGTVPGMASAAECTACPRMTVWNLETDWTSPRGPHGKTRLVSRASRRAAQHRYALSSDDALDMNLHLCSWAPASGTEVCRDEFLALWDELAYDWDNPWLGRSVRIFDIRHVASIPNGEDRLAHALLLGGSGTGACPHGQVAAAGALPFTGAGLLVPAISGTALVLGGLLTLRSTRGKQP